jgi:ribosomal RNA-processing protein 8
VNSSTPLGKRKRQSKAKGINALNSNTANSKVKKVKHTKCNVIFDDLSNWEQVIINHEAEDPASENLAQYITSAAEVISNENSAQSLNSNDNKIKKKGKKKKVKFDDKASSDLLSKSLTSGAGTALSNMNLVDDDSVTESTTSSLQSAKEKINKLKGKFQKKMDASQFRHINEKLYTTTGEEAMEMFAKKPELFDIYHRGFSNQVEKWEINPVDRIIDRIKKNGEDKVIADFGCGDAKIAQTLQNAVFSFDLIKHNEHVIVANSSKVPLADKSIDIAVFCLSLMGTDFKDFIREARRVLRSKGRLIVAEVSSRITDISNFVQGIEELGFAIVEQNEPNDYFTELVFKKTKPRENKGKFESLSLKPCSYKKR